jgi:probable addiction module antidote protein
LARLATEKETALKAHKAPASRPHDEAMVEMLKADPELADVYLATALEEATLPGGQFALLAALRHIAQAQGMAVVAEKAGIPRESLYRALSPKGNPTIKTMLAVLGAAGLQLAVTRQPDAPTLA